MSTKSILQNQKTNKLQSLPVGKREVMVVGVFPGNSTIPIIHEIDDIASSEGKAVMEYIEAHSVLPEHPESLPTPFIIAQGARLYKSCSIQEKKGILLLLAHHGSIEALDILEEYSKNPDPQLDIWVKIALEECITFFAFKNGYELMEEAFDDELGEFDA